MKLAVKNRKWFDKAYQFGKGSEMEQFLIHEGAIRKLPDGRYEVFSQEATNGSEQIAMPLDYFKVQEKNGYFYVYPVRKSVFEFSHIPVGGDTYLQKKQTAAGVGVCGYGFRGDPVSA